jgi:hypothetical protein
MNLLSGFRVARLFSNRHLALNLLLALLATAFFAANARAQTPLTISGTPDATVEAGKDYLFQPTSTGASVFSIVNKPSWATFSTTTGSLSGKPTFAATHSNVIILARDSAGAAVSLPGFSIVVTAVPLPLTISGTPATTVVAGTAYAFQPTATGATKFAILNKPAWAAFSTTTGLLSGAPSVTETYSNIAIFAFNAADSSVALPGFSITVTPGAVPLTISGTPATTAIAGTAYLFQPTATVASSFAIYNKPSWATFSTTTGLLSGTPTAAATHSNIVILASNNSGSAVSLPAFSIVVNQGAVRTATLSWTRPTLNTDGTALTDLSGYRIYCGTNPNALNQTLELSATVTTYVFENLSPATYYCAVTAYNATNAESIASNIVSKTIN